MYTCVHYSNFICACSIFVHFLLELNGDQQVKPLSTDYATPDGDTVWQTVYSGK